MHAALKFSIKAGAAIDGEAVSVERLRRKGSKGQQPKSRVGSSSNRLVLLELLDVDHIKAS
jgi:hypothetical protein